MYFTQINGGGGSSISKPKDLHISTGNTQKDNEIKELNLGKDYFDIVVDNLILNTEYSFQFAWKYEDGSYSEWSASKTSSTRLETAPAVPSQPTVTAGPGLINVTWNGNNAAGTTLQDYEKVNIYIGGTYKDSFFEAGTKSIPLAKGTYSVTLKSSSSTNAFSNATSPAVSATVTTDATDAAAALAGLDTKLNSSAAGIVQSNNNMTAINTSGITVYSGANSGTGARVVMNSAGIAGFNSSSTGPSNGATFSIDSSTGDAIFRGNITGSSGTFGGVTIDSSGISTSNNIFTLNTSGSSTIGGWTISSDKLSGSTIDLYDGGTYSEIKFYAASNFSMYSFSDYWGVFDSTSSKDIFRARSNESPKRLTIADPSGYIVQNANTTIDNKQLRNIYVSSTAGEPNPSSPSTGDIKLEW